MSKLQALGTNFWIYTSFILFAIVIIQILLSLIPSKRKPNELKGNGTDMNDLMTGLWKVEKAKKLYRIIRVVHPDSFPNDEDKKKIATQLSTEITANKLNYDKLLELRKRAENELNLSFPWEE